MISRLSSLTIFFPFYNDAQTVEKMISDAFEYGMRITEKLEVIAIHGGRSRDNTWGEIQRMKKKYPRLKVIDKSDNTDGYGVIRYGFKAATHEWVFYTDGDGQYSVTDLLKLVKKQRETQADVVNGYKLKRKDSTKRKILGSFFQHLHRLLTFSPIKDIHCDFRLIRSRFTSQIFWQTRGSTVISELILKLQAQDVIFAEVQIQHRKRKYGRSNYSVLKLIKESLQEILWSMCFRLKIVLM